MNDTCSLFLLIFIPLFAAEVAIWKFERLIIQICGSDAYWIFSLDVGFASLVMSLTMIHWFKNYESRIKNQNVMLDAGVILCNSLVLNNHRE